MNNDYPHANERLCTVARSWADGEISHEAWRKERRQVISYLLREGKDWKGESAPAPTSAPRAPATPTLPNMIPAQIPALPLSTGAAIPTTPVVVHEEVLMLAALLLGTIITAILFLYLL